MGNVPYTFDLAKHEGHHHAFSNIFCVGLCSAARKAKHLQPGALYWKSSEEVSHCQETVHVWCCGRSYNFEKSIETVLLQTHKTTSVRALRIDSERTLELQT